MKDSFAETRAQQLKADAEGELLQGNIAAAAEKLEEALTILEGAQCRLRAHILIAKGDTQWHSGELSAARASYEEALGIFTEENGQDSVVVALCLHSLSEICEIMGDSMAAFRYSRRASRIFRDGDDFSG